MTERAVHDVYSFVVGVYVVGIVWRIQEWLATGYGAIKAAGAPRVDIRAQLTTVLETGTIVAKTAFFGLAFGVLLPFLLGFMVELFLILPLRTALGDDVKMIFTMVRGVICINLSRMSGSTLGNNQLTWRALFFDLLPK